MLGFFNQRRNEAPGHGGDELAKKIEPVWEEKTKMVDYNKKK